MALSINFLLYKKEDLCLAPQNLLEKRGALVAHACSPRAGEAVKRLSGTYWSTGLTNHQSQGSVRDCLNKIKSN